MKKNELPSTEHFTFKECIVAGDKCILITPNHIGCKWTLENARFRSCIVRKSDLKVISQSFPKFKNWHEDPEFQKWDSSWPIDARHKLDGSTIIVSKHNGELVIRTRGTSDVRFQDTGAEVVELVSELDSALEDEGFASGKISLLFEHTGPSRIIVLRETKEPTLTLTGIIENETARLFTQKECDFFGIFYGIKRPEKYIYESISDCLEDVTAWSGAEGVVLYSPDGNTLKKIKAEEYLAAHALRTGVKGFAQVLDMFIASPKFTEPQDFYDYISTTIDFEVAEKTKGFSFEIVNIYNKVLSKMAKVREIVDKVRSFERKEQALEITGHWSDWRKQYGFIFLDNREFEDKLLAKAIENERL